MTTIAYDGRTLCADTQVSGAEIAFGVQEKIVRLADGRYLAAAGGTNLLYAAAEWLNGGEKPTLQADEQFVGLVVSADGSAIEICRQMRKFPACVPWSGGTGGVIAMAAMRLGHSAREAVELACTLDVWSGGPVTSIEISPTGRG